jgi:hypothetical protein
MNEGKKGRKQERKEGKEKGRKDVGNQAWWYTSLTPGLRNRSRRIVNLRPA